MKTPQHEFDMRTLDWFQSNTTRQDRKYTSTYFEIIWVKRGSGFVTTGFATYPVNDDRTFLLLPGQNRKFNIEPGAEGCYISFSRDFLESHSCQPGLASLLEPYVPDNIFPVKYNSAEEQADTAYIFLKLEQEFSGDFLFRSEIINTYLQTLLLSIARKINPDGKSMGQCREVEITRKFMTLLKEHFLHMKMVTDYAKELHISPCYLNSIVKHVSGYTVRHHIQQAIIREAKRQSSHSLISMKEIAYNLGFDDISHFSKYFKNNAGMNFSHYKKLSRQLPGAA